MKKFNKRLMDVQFYLKKGRKMKKTIKGLIRINSIYGIVDVNDIDFTDFLKKSGIKDFDNVKITIDEGKITIRKIK